MSSLTDLRGPASAQRCPESLTCGVRSRLRSNGNGNEPSSVQEFPPDVAAFDPGPPTAPGAAAAVRGADLGAAARPVRGGRGGAGKGGRGGGGRCGAEGPPGVLRRPVRRRCGAVAARAGRGVQPPAWAGVSRSGRARKMALPAPPMRAPSKNRGPLAAALLPSHQILVMTFHHSGGELGSGVGRPGGRPIRSEQIPDERPDPDEAERTPWSARTPPHALLVSS